MLRITYMYHCTLRVNVNLSGPVLTFQIPAFPLFLVPRDFSSLRFLWIIRNHYHYHESINHQNHIIHCSWWLTISKAPFLNNNQPTCEDRRILPSEVVAVKLRPFLLNKVSLSPPAPTSLTAATVSEARSKCDKSIWKEHFSQGRCIRRFQLIVWERIRMNLRAARVNKKRVLN